MFVEQSTQCDKNLFAKDFGTRNFSMCLSVLALLLLFVGPGIFPSTFASSVAPNAIIKQNSTSVAGYVLVTKSFDTITLAQGSFVVPKVSCIQSEIDTSVYFVSIGGEGAGIEIGCASGSSFYDSFCLNQYQYIAGCAAPNIVSPGDKLKAIIANSYTSGFVNVKLMDITKHWSLSTNAYDTSSVDVAFWVLQSESATLANFGMLKTSSNYATIGGHHGTIMSFSSSDKIEKDNLVDSANHLMAATSSLSSSGSSFSIKWVSST